MDPNEELHIIEINTDKKQFISILLIGDESETMIDRYLDKGHLYVGMCQNTAVAACVAVTCNDDTVEIKNLAVMPNYRRRGYGRQMLEHVERQHPGKTYILGTGETPSTLRFYRSCGYRYSHMIPNFFTDNYPTPIVEEGVTLQNMLYLKKPAPHPLSDKQ